MAFGESIAVSATQVILCLVFSLIYLFIYHALSAVYAPRDTAVKEFLFFTFSSFKNRRHTSQFASNSLSPPLATGIAGWT